MNPRVSKLAVTMLLFPLMATLARLEESHAEGISTSKCSLSLGGKLEETLKLAIESPTETQSLLAAMYSQWGNAKPSEKNQFRVLTEIENAKILKDTLVGFFYLVPEPLQDRFSNLLNELDEIIRAEVPYLSYLRFVRKAQLFSEEFAGQAKTFQEEDFVNVFKLSPRVWVLPVIGRKLSELEIARIGHTVFVPLVFSFGTKVPPNKSNQLFFEYAQRATEQANKTPEEQFRDNAKWHFFWEEYDKVALQPKGAAGSLDPLTLKGIPILINWLRKEHPHNLLKDVLTVDFQNKVSMGSPSSQEVTQPYHKLALKILHGDTPNELGADPDATLEKSALWLIPVFSKLGI